MPSAAVISHPLSSLATKEPLKDPNPIYAILLKFSPRNSSSSLAFAASRDAVSKHHALVSVVLMVMVSAAIGAAEAQSTWSTAELSVARSHLAAVSVGNLAIFAGGLNGAFSH